MRSIPKKIAIDAQLPAIGLQTGEMDLSLGVLITDDSYVQIDQSTSAVSAMAASASDISTDAIALDFDSRSPRLRISRSNGE